MRADRGRTLILTGVVLLVAALALTAYNLYDGWSAEQTASAAVSHLEAVIPPAAEPVQSVTEETEIPDHLLNPEMEMPVETVGEWNYIGVLEFPALGLELPVIDAWSYPALKVSPCRR